MKAIMILIAGLVTASTASANCPQIYSSIYYTCKIGERVVSVEVPEQEICGASYDGLINNIPVTINAGPVLDEQGMMVFQIAGPGNTTEIIGPCVEPRYEVE